VDIRKALVIAGYWLLQPAEESEPYFSMFFFYFCSSTEFHEVE
jgi:hypothetical protein